jgi:hypothetical protein
VAVVLLLGSTNSFFSHFVLYLFFIYSILVKMTQNNSDIRIYSVIMLLCKICFCFIKFFLSC